MHSINHPSYLSKNNLLFKAVGDICPGDKAILGLGIYSHMKKYGTDFPFRKINGLFHDADIVLGNFEGLLSRSVENDEVPGLTFCGLPSFVRELREAGFSVLNVANNHTLEHGPEIFSETVALLQGSGINVCGLRDTGPYYSKPVVIEVKGKTIGIIGYNWVGKDKFPEADRHIAQSHDSIVNYTWDRDRHRNRTIYAHAHRQNRHVIGDIALLKKEADFVILMSHWGYEFVPYPPYGVTREAHSFIDAGADLIIGGHPHVLQGVELYKGKNIFYSLGNFLFDMSSKQARRTAVLNIEINGENQVQWRMTPLRINKYFQPTPPTLKEEREILAIIEKSSEMILSSKNQVLLDDDILYREFEKHYNRSKAAAIIRHIKELPRHPGVIKIIYRKLVNFFNLMKQRLQGEKIRW